MVDDKEFGEVPFILIRDAVSEGARNGARPALAAIK